MFERDYYLQITAKILFEKYSEMTNKEARFRSELKRWYNLWERNLNNVSEEQKEHQKQVKESMVN